MTALAVAFPEIERDFDVGVDTVQWIFNAYAVIFGVFIVTGGRLADLYGRRRMFLAGATIFAVFSLLAGIAPSAFLLIVARALMGVGGALMWPAVLAMTFTVLPKNRAALASGIVLGAAGFGNATGPLLGGILTDALSWRWILFLNVPIALVASLAAGHLRIIEQRSRTGALIPREVFANREFRTVCLSVLLMSVTFFSALLYLPQFMTKILGWSALSAGLGLLPITATFAVTAFVAGTLYERFGGKVLLSIGALSLVVGAILTAWSATSSSWAALVPGMAALGLGVGLFLSSATTAGVAAIGEAQSGLAGGLIYMFQIAGGSIGLALTTSVYAIASDRSVATQIEDSPVSLTDKEQHAVQGLLAGTESASQITNRMSESAAKTVESIVRDGFGSGLQWAFGFVALLAIVGLLITVTSIGGPVSALWRRRTPRS